MDLELVREMLGVFAQYPQITLGIGYALALALCVLYWEIRTRPRTYYFVRHGETLLNKQKIKQGAEGGLSDEGKQQAEEVGKALEGLHIRVICASPYERARETAEIIRAHIHAPIRYASLLVERKNPTSVIGKSTHDPYVKQAVALMDLSFHTDDYRFEDEENFIDLKKRAKACLAYLEGQGSPSVCVVTHHAFLKMLLAYALYREGLHADAFVKLSFYNTSDNGGITTCVYYPRWSWFSSTHGWEIEGYNEHVAGE